MDSALDAPAIARPGGATLATRRPLAMRLMEFVKIEHSLFALPFVLAGLVLGFEAVAVSPFTAPGIRIVALSLVAAVAARTLAMTLNRLIDVGIDSRNPRTAERSLVTGEISKETAVGIAILSLVALVYAAGELNPLALLLAAPLVGLFVLYPYTKRFTWGCHFVLGLALGCAPLGGYIAVTGSTAGIAPVTLLGFAVYLWVAGFDILYSLLDIDFDRKHGIGSIAGAFGADTAKLTALSLHAGMLAVLAMFAAVKDLDIVFTGALGIATLLLFMEHRLVRKGDVASINKAFFNVNAMIGWILLAGIWLGLGHQ
ncbi:MAG: 4-hydroxybenzoate octaprenyltransferase [Euryarchaeota archaeon]|nr:4-hydroxybenzoate octaprenyltransferase [Euryarchaeota archaeon]